MLTDVNPARDAGDTSPPNFLVGGTSTGISPQYYYVLSDIAEQYWLPSVRSASSRFHWAIRRHKFASVRQADSRLTRLVPTNLELALMPPSMLWKTQVRSTTKKMRVSERRRKTAKDGQKNILCPRKTLLKQQILEFIHKKLLTSPKTV